jgi:hypothetical protein
VTTLDGGLRTNEELVGAPLEIRIYQHTRRISNSHTHVYFAAKLLVVCVARMR